MRHTVRTRLLTYVVIGALSCGLASCALTPRPGVARTGAATETPESTKTPVGSTPTSVTGPVTLALGKQRYAQSDTIVVTIHNGLATPIFALDEHSDCTVVQLERQVNGSWQAAGSCVNGLPHPTIDQIAPGATQTVQLLPGGTGGAGVGAGSEAQWTAGTYRAGLRFVTSADQPVAQGSTTYSALFVVS